MTDHTQLSAVLERAEADLGASESHGILCGLLCCPGGDRGDDWILEIAGPDRPAVPIDECGQTLRALRLETQRQLNSERFEFVPLLPGDGESIARRSEQLAAWCRGYLYGLSLGGLGGMKALSVNAQEVIHDVSTLAGIQPGPDTDEEEERAFVELVEYLRTGVMLINLELHTMPTGAGDAGVAH